MFVVSVVPLKKGITIEALSYFSKESYDEGALIQILIRNTPMLGLVVSCAPASTAKTALKAATFSLRKLPPQEKPAVLTKALRTTARELCEYYATTIGSILYALLPTPIQNGECTLPHTAPDVVHDFDRPLVFSASRNERFLTYRSLVRETFAHSGSILIVAPSSIEAFTLRDAVGVGIEDRTIILSTAHTKSEQKRAYQSLEDYTRTQLIIATPTHSILERHDITTVIIERESAGSYVEMTRPYLDYRIAHEIHSKHTGRRLIYADLVIRAEEEYKRRNDTYGTYGETPKRVECVGKLTVYAKEKKDDAFPKTPFTLLSNTVLKHIDETQKKRGKTFMLASRRGLAPIVACMDCGEIMRSKKSGAPYTLMKTVEHDGEKRWFVCGSSGEKIQALNTCPQCGSWRLRERGVGIQHLHDELHKARPSIPIILFDQTTAKTFKRASYLRDTFYNTKGAILLGTYMALPYISKPIDLSVVTSVDTMLLTPTWRLEEMALSVLLSLREVTNGNVVLETTNQETSIINHAKLGTLEQFYTEELDLRSSLSYPPFAHFIHFTWQSEASVSKETIVLIQEIFNGYNLHIYESPFVRAENTIMYALIRHTGAWPNNDLVSRIQSLPPYVRVTMNPDRIV